MLRLRESLHRNGLALILAAVVGALGLNCPIAPRGVCDLLTLRRHRLALEWMRELLDADHRALDQEVKRLRSDDRYLQRLIRRELGFARRDELVYRFETETPRQR